MKEIKAAMINISTQNKQRLFYKLDGNIATPTIVARFKMELFTPRNSPSRIEHPVKFWYILKKDWEVGRCLKIINVTIFFF